MEDVQITITTTIDRYEDLLHTEQSANILRQLVMQKMEESLSRIGSGYYFRKSIEEVEIDADTLGRLFGFSSTIEGYKNREKELLEKVNLEKGEITDDKC